MSSFRKYSRYGRRSKSRRRRNTRSMTHSVSSREDSRCNTPNSEKVIVSKYSPLLHARKSISIAKVPPPQMGSGTHESFHTNQYGFDRSRNVLFRNTSERYVGGIGTNTRPQREVRVDQFSNHGNYPKTNGVGNNTRSQKEVPHTNFLFTCSE